MELEKAVLATGETVEGVLERWLATFSRRLVALCGATVELDDQGKAKKETFFCYTGFLIEVDERWYHPGTYDAHLTVCRGLETSVQ